MSDLLARVNINGPLVLLVAGYTLGNPDWGPLSVDVEASSIHLLAEVTLALLLFADASRVERPPAQARRPFPRTPSRDRPSTLGRSGLSPGGLASSRPHVGPGRLRRCDPGADRRRPERPGDQRRAASPCGYAESSTSRVGSTTESSRPIVAFMLAVAAGQLGRRRRRALRWRGRAAGAGHRRRRRSCHRVGERPRHHARVASELDRHGWATRGHPCRSAQQLRARSRSGRQRVHRGVRGRDRVRSRAGRRGHGRGGGRRAARAAGRGTGAGRVVPVSAPRSCRSPSTTSTWPCWSTPCSA